MSSSASSRVTDTPSRASPSAVINPTGPPPTIKTSVMPLFLVLQVTGAVVRKSCSERTGIGAAVDQDILPGDVAGLRRAQERAGRAEFVGVPKPPGRIGRSDFLGDVADVTRGTLRQRCQIRLQAVGIEGAGQQIVDGHIV